MTDESTFLYLVSNEDLGYYKVGIGFGNRLEKWRREGWKLEQEVLFERRQHAEFAELLVKRVLADLKIPLAGSQLRHDLPSLDEGSTESWPFSWGSIDLTRVAEIANSAWFEIGHMLVSGALQGVVDGVFHLVDSVETEQDYEEALDGLDRVQKALQAKIHGAQSEKNNVRPNLRAVDHDDSSQ